MWGDINNEPKRTNRFLIAGFGGDLAFSIQEVTLPKFKVSEAKVEFISHTFKYPGKVEWADVSMTLVDAIDPNTSDIIMQIIRDAGYVFPFQGAGEATTEPLDPYVLSFSKANFNAALGRIGIRTIDALGVTIDEWWLENSWLKSVEPGQLKMSEAGILNLKLEIAYDWASYENVW